MGKITQKQWEEYVITTAMLLGWEEYRYGQKEGQKWRRAMAFLEEKKGMHVCINGTIVQFRDPEKK